MGNNIIDFNNDGYNDTFRPIYYGFNYLKLQIFDTWGNLIYTDYFLQFQLAGFILLVAMIGAIVLTLRHRDYVRRQNINNQINRDSKSSIELVNIKLNDRDKK